MSLTHLKSKRWPLNGSFNGMVSLKFRFWIFKPKGGGKEMEFVKTLEGSGCKGKTKVRDIERNNRRKWGFYFLFLMGNIVCLKKKAHKPV